MKKFKFLYLTGLALVFGPIIIFVSMFFLQNHSFNDEVIKEEIVKVYDTIKVKKVEKVFDTIKVEKIKWVEKIKPDSLNPIK